MLLSLSRVNPGKRLGLRRHESGGGAGLDLLVDLHLSHCLPLPKVGRQKLLMGLPRPQPEFGAETTEDFGKANPASACNGTKERNRFQCLRVLTCSRLSADNSFDLMESTLAVAGEIAGWKIWPLHPDK